MGLRDADLCLTLPRRVASAIVLGALDAWAEGLRLGGAGLPAPDGGPPDLVVAPAPLAREALSTGADFVVIEGAKPDTRQLGADHRRRRFALLPEGARPDLLVPLGARAPARYALARLRPPATIRGRIRNAVAAEALARDAVPRGRGVRSVWMRSPGPPFALQEAVRFGVPPDAGWFMTLGEGDPLTRVVLHLFAPESRTPGWVLKIARVADREAPFEADERALRMVEGLGGAAALHAPRLIARFHASGLPCSLETAIPGERLSTLLRRRGASATSRRLIETIAAWIVQVGRESAAAPAALADERRRLAEHVVPAWESHGVARSIVDDLPDIPAVLQHNDLGTWNVVADGTRFGAVDWESGRRHGLPLWDLLYFLASALALVDGATGLEDRADHAIRLLRGEAPSSSVLFEWIRRAAAELELPASAVGPVATLCWLHHGLSHQGRWEAAERAQPGSAGFIPPIERIAPRWLADPALGPGWSVWQQG